MHQVAVLRGSVCCYSRKMFAPNRPNTVLRQSSAHGPHVREGVLCLLIFLAGKVYQRTSYCQICAHILNQTTGIAAAQTEPSLVSAEYIINGSSSALSLAFNSSLAGYTFDPGCLLLTNNINPSYSSFLIRITSAPIGITLATNTLILDDADTQAIMEHTLTDLNGDYSSLLIGPLNRACFSVGNTTIKNSFSFVPLRVVQQGEGNVCHSPIHPLTPTAVTLLEASIEPYGALLQLKFSASIMLTSANLSALSLSSSNASIPLGPSNAAATTANTSSNTHYIQLGNQIEDAFVALITYGWEPMTLTVDRSFVINDATLLPFSAIQPLGVFCKP